MNQEVKRQEKGDESSITMIGKSLVRSQPGRTVLHGNELTNSTKLAANEDTDLFLARCAACSQCV